VTYQDILGALGLDGANDSCSDHQLLPGLGQVQVMDTVFVASINVVFHVFSAVLSTDVDLRMGWKPLYEASLTSAATMLTRSCSLFFVYNRAILLMLTSSAKRGIDL
jgi:hypothetical protein